MACIGCVCMCDLGVVYVCHACVLWGIYVLCVLFTCGMCVVWFMYHAVCVVWCVQYRNVWCICQCDWCVSGVICMLSEYVVCNVCGVGIWCVSVDVVCCL